MSVWSAEQQSETTRAPSAEYTTVHPGLRNLFGIGKSRGWELLASGKIRGRKFGKRTLVECASVREFMTALPTAR